MIFLCRKQVADKYKLVGRTVRGYSIGTPFKQCYPSDFLTRKKIFINFFAVRMIYKFSCPFESKQMAV